MTIGEKPSAGFTGRLFRRLWKWLPLIGFLLLILVLFRLDREKILQLIPHFQLKTILLFMLTFSVSLLMRIGRWHFLVSARGSAPGWRRNFSAYLSANFYAAITPGRAGELFKAASLHHHGFTSREAFLLVVLDRVLDVYFLIIFALAGYLAEYHRVQPLWIFPALLFPPVFSFAISKKFPRENPAHPGKKNLPGLIREFLPAGRLVFLIAATVVIWVLYFCGGVLYAADLSIPLPPLTIAFAMAAAILASLVPISMHGIGTREWVFLTLFARHGVNPEPAVALSLAALLSMLFLSVCYGGWFAWRERKHG